MENTTIQNNLTTTRNGAVVFKESESKVLDLFNRGGSRDFLGLDYGYEHITKLVHDAYEENPLLTVKTLFYLRDFRGKGQGFRDIFRVGLKYLSSIDTDIVNVVPLVAEYGRYDDLLCFIDTPNEAEMVITIKEQLSADLKAFDEGEPISLLAKWLPSINTSSYDTVLKGRKIASLLGMTEKEYRKMLSKLRGYGNVLEVKLSNNEFDTVDYEKIPSLALHKYRNAFSNKDSERYNEYLEKITNGETSVKISSLYPHDILGSFLGKSWFSFKVHRDLTESEITLANAQWDKLVAELKEKVDVKGYSLPVIDTSGSMAGLPLKVALALGILMAEANEGIYHNKFMLFDKASKIYTLEGNNLYEKLSSLLSNQLTCLSTNIESTFDLILNDAIEKKLTQSQLPTKLVYFSDMEFNEIPLADYELSYQTPEKIEKTLLQSISDKFKRAGYVMPKIVFWNLNGNVNNRNSMATASTDNIALLSGFSDSQMARILSGDIITPYNFMLQAINDSRYDDVEKYYTLSV